MNTDKLCTTTFYKSSGRLVDQMSETDGPIRLFIVIGHNEKYISQAVKPTPANLVDNYFHIRANRRARGETYTHIVMDALRCRGNSSKLRNYLLVTLTEGRNG